MTVTSACPNPSSATAIYTVNVANAVTVDAGPSDQTVCSTSPDVILQGLIGGSADAGFWSSNVSGGTFTPADGSYNPNPPYVTYTPPPGILADGGHVTLTLKTVDQTEGFGGECFASKERYNSHTCYCSTNCRCRSKSNDLCWFCSHIKSNSKRN